MALKSSLLLLNFTVDEMRQKFMQDDMDTHHGYPRAFRRDHIYSDVIEAYQDDLEEILREFPFRVRYEKERAVDTGGVCRDMFSAFWEQSYLKNFDGERLLVPAVNPNVDMSLFRLLGTVLSHGFMVCGFLPVRIAFPIIAAVLYGPEVKIPNSVIIESFKDYLATYESKLISQALADTSEDREFQPSLQNQLISTMSRFGCVEIPTKMNMQHVIISTARHQFLGKPLGILYTIHSGVPKPYLRFWEQFTIEEFFQLYKALNATPDTVLRLIQEADDMNSAQSRVFSYLTTFISNSKQDVLRLFLRFVTGSSVLMDKGIKVTFNQLTGLARRPISHTCECSLELSVSYTTFPEFEQEFSRVLSSEASWAMDAI